MNFWSKLWAGFKHHFVPAEHNAYRPNSLSRDVLVAAVSLTCVVEGFLVASLFLQNQPNNFTAAVIESALVSLTNSQREEKGYGDLHVDPALTKAAQAKADDMASRGYFSHVGPTGEQPWVWFTAAGYDYGYAGENLATRFYESSDVVNAWMNSPGHRANILKGVYKDIGIGISHGMYEGQETTFVVQFFGTSRAQLGIAPSTFVPKPQGTVKSAEITPTTHVVESSPAPKVSEATIAPGTHTQTTNSEPVVAPENPLTTVSPAVDMQTIKTVERPQVPGAVAKFLTSPRTIALFLLGSIIAFLILALVTAVFVRVHIQPLDLLANGAVVAIFTLLLFSANVYFLSGADVPPGLAAVPVSSSR